MPLIKGHAKNSSNPYIKYKDDKCAEEDKDSRIDAMYNEGNDRYDSDVVDNDEGSDKTDFEGRSRIRGLWSARPVASRIVRYCQDPCSVPNRLKYRFLVSLRSLRRSPRCPDLRLS